MPVPFVIYAGFKAIKEKVRGSQPNIDKSYTETYQKHKDSGWIILIRETFSVNNRVCRK